MRSGKIAPKTGKARGVGQRGRAAGVGHGDHRDQVGDARLYAFGVGAAPNRWLLDELGLPHVVFASVGTSEDIAMLLAFERGADLIVAVGTHSSMVDFLDKGRPGMASTFLVRIKDAIEDPQRLLLEV